MRSLLARPSLLTPLALAALLWGCEPLSPAPSPDEATGSITQPAGESCGGLTGERCVKGTYCDFPADALCGAADQTGTCQPAPEACDAQYAPVCGCDDRSYGNECEAHAKGVSVAHAGSCAPQEDAGTAADAATRPADAATRPPDAATRPDAAPPSERICGGFAALACARGEFCDYGASCSSIADGSGVCRPQPSACTLIYAPVCGCDGNTYGNECAAHTAGVSVAVNGACKPTPGSDAGSGKVCGGIAGLACARGEFCDYGASCSSIADGTGICAPQPQACTEEYQPVCGCDGNTYGNTCAAHGASVSVAGKGECVPKRVSCDRRSLLCRRAEPVCPAGQTASIEGTCYGPCVDIEQCSCKEAEACPNADQYTCHLSRGVCGPYVR